MDQLLEFAGNHPLLITAATVMTIVVIVNELRLYLRGVNDVTPQEATRLINNNALVVDVRNHELFLNGHIINAKNAPLTEMDQHMAKLSKNRGDRVIITCGEVGPTGARGASLMKKAGIENVVNLKGGITGWQRDNLPLKKGK